MWHAVCPRLGTRRTVQARTCIARIARVGQGSSSAVASGACASLLVWAQAYTPAARTNASRFALLMLAVSAVLCRSRTRVHGIAACVGGLGASVCMTALASCVLSECSLSHVLALSDSVR